MMDNRRRRTVLARGSLRHKRRLIFGGAILAVSLIIVLFPYLAQHESVEPSLCNEPPPEVQVPGKLVQWCKLPAMTINYKVPSTRTVFYDGQKAIVKLTENNSLVGDSGTEPPPTPQFTNFEPRLAP